MSNKFDLTGNIYGRLTVLNEGKPYISPRGRERAKWLCKCECGSTKEIVGNSLRKGATTSCGCYARENLKENPIRLKHGDIKSKEYKAWKGMTQRCCNPNDKGYANYGGRGITVCDAWLNSYEQFLDDVGRAPSKSHSIDRIDVNGNYEPSNVRWATNTVQAINQRIYSNNTSGYVGVSWCKSKQKWIAQIGINKKNIALGYFSTKEEALAARKLAEEIHHKPLLNKMK